MKKINFKKEVIDTVDGAIKRIEIALKPQGFGILTRIDLDSKINEKIGKFIPRVVILGACNPSLAYEAFQINSDVASLLPCNIVVRDLENGKVSVEIAKPTSMMEIIGDNNLIQMSKAADTQLENVLNSL